MLGLNRVHVYWCPFKSREPYFLKKLLAKGTINQASNVRELSFDPCSQCKDVML